MNEYWNQHDTKIKHYGKSKSKLIILARSLSVRL